MDVPHPSYRGMELYLFDWVHLVEMEYGSDLERVGFVPVRFEFGELELVFLPAAGN